MLKLSLVLDLKLNKLLLPSSSRCRLFLSAAVLVGLIVLATASASAQTGAPLLGRLTVIPDTLQVSTSSDYTIQFTASGVDLYDLADGGLSLVFPSPYNLAAPFSVSVSHSDSWATLEYSGHEVIGDTVLIHLVLDPEQSSEPPTPWALDTVDFEIQLGPLKNGYQAGETRVWLAAFDKAHEYLCVWCESDPFWLTAGPCYAVAVEPSDDVQMAAGDTVVFSASGRDEYGNLLEEATTGWRLTEESDPIGYFAGNRFVATTVGEGQAVAEVDGVTGYSGSLTVSPAALSQLVVNIAPQQIVGQPLINTAQILLLDENSNLVTDYDLEDDPIVLMAQRGSLTPDTLSDTALFSEGVVNFLPADVRYSGTTGSVEIFAQNSSIASLGVFVSFSGYDIAGASDVFGLPLSRIYSGLLTDIFVRVNNDGDQVAVQNPTLRAFFASGGGSVQRFITPKAGDEDTVLIALPTTNLPLGQDTLVLVLNSRYRINGDTAQVLDTLRVPVEVLSAAEFLLAENSFRPDSVYANHSFSLSFDVTANGFSGPIDGTHLAVELLDDDDSVVVTLFDGQVGYSDFSGGVIRYRAIQAEVDAAHVDTSRFYKLHIDYQLISEGSFFSLSQVPVDSLFILPERGMVYESGTFMPTAVGAGQEAFFVFDVTLDGGRVLDFNSAGSSFQIQGEGFSTTTNLTAVGDSLLPGLNTLETERVFIPADQLGDSLTVTAVVQFADRGAGNYLTFSTDFDGQKVGVQELPLVRIQEASIVALNAPRVNAGQAFQVCCRISNTSTTDQGPFELQMVSDGTSEFNSMLALDGVPGGDTAEVFFDVTAGSTSATEIFRVDIATLGINELPPLDNIAIATVQQPASIELTYQLVGAQNGFVNINETFSVIVGLENAGEADASAGVFEVSTNGDDLGRPDPDTVLVDVGVPEGFSFEAPPYDTTILISFTVIERPVDANVGLPAAISDTTFEIPLAVITPNVELLAQVDAESDNVVLPGAIKEMFRLRLINQGVSSVTDVRLESAALLVKDPSGQALDARRVLEVGSAGFYEGTERVARATAGADRLNLLFDDMVVAAGDTVDLGFQARIKAIPSAEFTLQLDVSDIEASFANGPLVGQQVVVVPGGDSSLVLDEAYTSVSVTLDGSFIIRDNPFNPLERAAEFQYNLEEPSAIEFYILTLTGEEVFSQTLALGEAGTDRGLHAIFWDGRNDVGEMVLNGVYVAVLLAPDSGEDARLKVAVLK